MISRTLKIIRPLALGLVIALLVQATLLVISLPISLPAAAAIENVYVNINTGNDSYDGSSPTFVGGTIGPKKTITAGISAASSTGTVNVAAGTYVECIHLTEDQNLVGAGALTTIIDGGSNGTVITVSSAPYQRNTISGFTIRNGGPGQFDPGGGIYIGQFHIVTINDCAIINNTKDVGVVIGSTEDFFGTKTAYALGLRNGGGGICNAGGTLYMNRCTVSGNTAAGLGGGIAIFRPGFFAYRPAEPGFLCQPVFAVDGEGEWGLAELTNCTISGNTAAGGIIEITGTEGEGLYCTAGISYVGEGGGIYCDADTTVRLLYVTIANNQATGEGSMGGGFSQGTGTPLSMYFKNCIVANNTAGDGVHNNGHDVSDGTGIHSEGYNIDSENSCFFNQATDKHNVNPGLGPLRNNGGPTSTRAITASSPAYNTGSCTPPSWWTDAAVTTDQRGITRPQNGRCDIGAYELVYTPQSPQAPQQKPLEDSSSPPLTQGWAFPPHIVATYLNVQPQQAQANQPVTIHVNMANRGDESGSYTAILKINGETEQTKTDNIGGHVAVPLRFEVIKNEPGIYHVDVNGQQASFVILDDGSKKPAPTKDWAIGGFVICAIGVVAVSVLLIRHRRNAY